MSRATRIAVGIVIVIFLVAAGAYWYVSRNEPSAPATPVEETQQASTVETPSTGQGFGVRLDGVELEGSDAVVREVVASLSRRPELAAWLANEDLVRRFVAAVNNVAAGESPKAHVGFLKPDEPFAVRREGDRIVVDPASWHRYDTMAEVFASLDTEGVIQLLAEIRPLIDEAQREIAPPGADFQSTLLRAIDRVLAVPEIDGNEALQPKVVTFVYENEKLENLPEVERQVLRMGPENIAKIKAKLREIKRQLAP